MGGKCVGTCSVDGCGKRVLARKLCSMHYYRLMHHGEVGSAATVRPGGECSIDGCDRRHKGHGLCEKHLNRSRTHDDPTVKLKGGRPTVGEHKYDNAIAKGAQPRSVVSIAPWGGPDEVTF